MERASRIQLQQHTNGAQPSVTGGITGRPTDSPFRAGATISATPKTPDGTSTAAPPRELNGTKSEPKPESNLKTGPKIKPIRSAGLKIRFQIGSCNQEGKKETNKI